MLTLLTSLCSAQGLSVDSQLLYPALGEGALPGIPAPPLQLEGWLIGGLAQAELTPVRLHQAGGGATPVIELRATATPALAFQQGRARFSLALPFGRNMSNAQTELSHNGSFRGDPRLSVAYRVLGAPDRPEASRLGLQVSAFVPMGTSRTWSSEAFARQQVSLQGLKPLGDWRLAVELGWQRRVREAPTYSYTPASELLLRAGASRMVSEQVTLHSTLLWEATPSAAGWEERAVEVLIGLQFNGKPGSVGLGRGVTRGLGTSQGRVWLSHAGVEIKEIGGGGEPLETEVLKEEPRPDTDYTVSRAVGMTGSSTLTLQDEAPEAPPQVSSNGLAEVVDDRIEIREPIRFEVGTEVILEESLPVLEAVAELIAQYPELAHVAVVGHASAEGEYADNYALSTRRARSVYEQLLVYGVHPQRLSFRGMGEVEPASEELALNRRVEFQIVNQLHPLDDPGTLPTEAPLPWNGEMVPIVQPPPPVLPEEIPDPRPEIDPSTFDTEEEL